jgi:hypothetical protein
VLKFIYRGERWFAPVELENFPATHAVQAEAPAKSELKARQQSSRQHD